MNPLLAKNPHNLAGSKSLKDGKPDQAFLHYKAAYREFPQEMQLLELLAFLAFELKIFREAMGYFKRLLQFNPRHTQAQKLLAVVLFELGRQDEALRACERAIELNPQDHSCLSDLIFMLEYEPNISVARQQEVRRNYGRVLSLNHPRLFTHYSNSPDPDRPLRIGYVSGDFRNHSAAYTFGQLIGGHDLRSFEVYLYSHVRNPDPLTDFFRGIANVWRETGEMKTEALARLIQKDGIDILIDLSGHSDNKHLGVFAHKPAPLQGTGWGYGSGTGLETIDVFFADPILVPPDETHLYAEKIVYLPCTISLELPHALRPQARPMAAGMTFGCLNRMKKVTTETIASWARILRAAPQAKLLLKSPEFDDPHFENLFKDKFVTQGAAAAQLILRGSTTRKQHLETYHEIDLALDPFPQGGGISTLEAIAMGVPVLCQAGTTPGSRISSSIMSALLCTEFIAPDLQSYEKQAVDWRQNLPYLRSIRASLREKLEESPLGNALTYAGLVEQEYRKMWREWCAQQDPSEGRVTPVPN